MKFGSRFSLILLVVLSLAGALYMGRFVLGVDPTKQFTRFRVVIPTSGGLLDDSPVLINGRIAGKIHAINVVAGGLQVDGEYDAKYQISKKSVVVIADLSAAGEQYLNFTQPPDNEGPYIKDGDVIDDPRQIHVSSTVGDALAKASAVANQLDPEVLDDISTTFDQIFSGIDPELEQARELLRQSVHVVERNHDRLGSLFANARVSLDLLDRLAPKLPGIAEKSKRLDGSVIAILDAFSKVQTLNPSKQATLDRLAALVDRYLTDILTDSHPLLMALKPISAYFRTTYFDPGSTMDTLLKMLPQDGVPRVVLNMAG